MTLQVHSRLILSNLFVIAFLSVLFGYFLNFSHLALAVFIAVGTTFLSSYVVRVLVSRPLRRISDASTKLAEGDLQRRVAVSDEYERLLGQHERRDRSLV